MPIIELLGSSALTDVVELFDDSMMTAFDVETSGGGGGIGVVRDSDNGSPIGSKRRGTDTPSSMSEWYEPLVLATISRLSEMVDGNDITEGPLPKDGDVRMVRSPE